ncbi:hypothetical protein M406DRAFT_296579 [Cryphonectria parasitica EP155]|uniref:Uncharacterized protein n=1 Tax=Cryphonectria parasitica (strain ATCC 38755 / EP155) TaxID=660469 RepID=A0A9P5CKC0_CRYP1|nr:uncharacterized protein M406DRAFT_296579 [Cryphonectria parasitica EP155]KAF3761042.1 hypothetical protein M406DRAFT_296579 [Cryphonectria parasitica EP155]
MALDFFKSLFGWREPQRPARVPTDEVIPMYDFDSRPQIRDIIIGWTLRFDDILDADKLHVALVRLLEIGDWRKLGGRLRKNGNGQLEIHIPAEFTPKRPAVRFSHEIIDMAIAEHPLAVQLPTPTTSGSIQEGADQFETLAAPEDAPRCLGDFLARDVSQLGLHVVSFSDATLVSLTFPHTMCDLLGLQAIVDNWVKILSGREDDVVPLLGVHEDPIADVGTGPLHKYEEKWALKDNIMSGFGWFRFVLTMIWDAIRLGPSEQHMIYLPASSLARLRESAKADLAAVTSSNIIYDWHPQNVYLTDNDILTAWITRMAARSLSPGSSHRSITFVQFFELRGRLPAVFQPPERAVYIGNFIFACWAHLTARDAQHAPLGAIAGRYRAFLAAQTTEGQVRGLLRVFRERTAAGRRIGAMRPDSMMITCSNWSKAKFFAAVDFSPAVVRKGKSFGQPKFGSGRPVYYHGLNLRPLGSGRSRQVGAATGVNILGKDAGGNYWIMAMLPPKSWPMIQQELAVL